MDIIFQILVLIFCFFPISILRIFKRDIPAKEDFYSFTEKNILNTKTRKNIFTFTYMPLIILSLVARGSDNFLINFLIFLVSLPLVLFAFDIFKWHFIRPTLMIIGMLINNILERMK